MKKMFVLIWAGIAVVSQVPADVEIAGSWGQSVKKLEKQKIHFANAVYAKEGDVFVLTYAANKKCAYTFNVTSAKGLLSAASHYEERNGAVSGVIYYRVESDGDFDLAAFQEGAAFTSFGAYHLTSTSGNIKELVHAGKRIGAEGESDVSCTYDWDGELRSGVLIEGISSYRSLGIPKEVKPLLSEGDDKRLSGYSVFSGKRSLSLKWGTDPVDEKGNFALTGVVFVETELLSARLGFLF